MAIVHLAAGTTAALAHPWRPKALSAASGVNVAYVFLDLLPDLAEQQTLIDRVGLFPGVDRHIYILALVLAYIAGGTIMNILRHELPDTDRSSDVFAFAAAVYGTLLLSLSPAG